MIQVICDGDKSVFVHRHILLSYFGNVEGFSCVPMKHQAASLAFRLLYGGAELVHMSAGIWLRNYLEHEHMTALQFMILLDSIDTWMKQQQKSEFNTLLLCEEEGREFLASYINLIRERLNIYQVNLEEDEAVAEEIKESYRKLNMERSELQKRLFDVN